MAGDGDGGGESDGGASGGGGDSGGSAGGARGSGDGESGGGARGSEDGGSGGDGSAEGTADVVLRLPDDVREEFREPLGPVYTDADELLADAGAPIVAVGDVVTYHLERAGRTPDVSVVDWRSERAAVGDEVGSVVGDLGEAHELVTVENPAATLTAGLLAALRAAIEDAAGGTDGDGEPTVVEVDGEEDLATLPAVLSVPDGGSVVYGQPGEGMVLVTVDDGVRERVRELFGTLAGEHGRARELLGLEG